MYEVKYLNEDKESIDFGKWINTSLVMCNHSRMCKECKKDIKHMDNCDYTFYNTNNLQIAKDKKEYLEKEGLKVKIVEVENE